MHGTRSFTNPHLLLTAVCAVVLGLSSVGCGGSDSGTTPNSNCTTLTQAEAVFNLHSCAAGGCHDGSATTAAGFDMATAGWETHLVGGNPIGGKPLEACMQSDGPYLTATSNPATGLFISKISQTNPPCGLRMPYGLTPLTATEIACVTSWATTLTHP